MGLLVFDSGLGGLTVLAEIRKARPDLAFTYLADDAVFPYGRLSEADLVARVLEIVVPLAEAQRPEAVVIACNTASTLVLPPLRARLAMPVVGTVPAIKPAAAMSRSKHISVLATPGTVARDYTRELVEQFAGDCAVALVGAPKLAELAEAALHGETIADAAIAAEIAGCFVEAGGSRTDVVALACTHYPLLRSRLERLAPWPVAWVDPAPAIARRVVHLIGPPQAQGRAAQGEAMFTSGRAPTPVLAAALRAYGLTAAR